MRKPADELLWLIATISVVLPIAGGILGVIGFAMLIRGTPGGGWWLAGGIALIVLDYLTDIWLYRLLREQCEEPSLNDRGQRHVGRTAVLEQPIEAGRGRIRLGDSWWIVEGPDLEKGVKVRVVAARGTMLIVEAVEPRDD